MKYTRGKRAPKMRPLSRRHMLGRLARGTMLGTLGVSGAGSAYLLITALLKLLASPAPRQGILPPAVNTARVITNPRNGRMGLLIHLPDGTLVAYERACTHV